MSEENKNTQQEMDSIKQLQRALFYESQFRNAIVSDAVSFYDANITKDVIESDFFFRDDDNDFVSVPDYIGITTPCKFSDFVNKWSELMIPDLSQKTLLDIRILREKLIDVYNNGKREYVMNYWAENINGKKIFYNQRFLLTRNEFGDVCALSILKDYTKLREADDEYLQNELEQYAYTDPVTNGYNYIRFKERLKELSTPGSIACLDIHSFKTINSICGTTKGDDVIRYIWQCLLAAIDVPKGELAAHINADHYIIFFPTINEDEIIKKLKNITLALLVVSVNIDVPQINPYFGISKWAPGKKIEMSYSEAIIAKHNAKYQQNMNYAFFNEEDTNRLIREKELLDSFEEAMARKEFKIWFQPKYTPRHRKLVGAEALVRWIKKDGTVINPDEFIPLFERNNMIRPLDEYVFRNVCQFQKKWMDEGKNIVPVSVNLSRASLYYKGVTEQYKRLTEIIGIDTKNVPIEITESAAVKNEDVKEIIDKFHNCGFSLQMDDFGSGYSSLASLNLMHFDTLKLDKSLIDFIGNFGGNRLIEHTISLAKELGIQITAEGVENEAQVEFLRHIGCDSIQGFFYSKPVPSQEYEKILCENNEEEVTSESLKIDLVEDHLYGFNQSYYKPAMYSFVINLTKDVVTDYTEHQDWALETNIQSSVYSEALSIFANNFIVEDQKEAFIKFMGRENNLAIFDGTEQTRIAEYKRKYKNSILKMRIITNLFKVENNDEVWLYAKIFTL